MQIDIDHFKAIKDRFGHDIGDHVIRCVAHILRETGALAGQLGGEELAVLMPGHALGQAAVTAHRIRSQCATTSVVVPAGSARFTVSIGLSEWVEGDSIATLLKRADVALYAARQGGRDRVAMTSAELRTKFLS